jgi:hypothetical protein
MKSKFVARTRRYSERLFCLILLTGGFLCLPAARGQVNVVMQHYDLNRTGANTSESTLTTANVNTNQFGKLFSQSVDGKVYAQPLYVAGLTVNSGTHNVVYICTDNNSVYAFDADSGSSGALWHVNLGTPVPNSDVGGCSDMSPQIGITGTPAIDTSGGTIYLDARTLTSGTYAHKLHALDLTTGAEKFGGPVTISASQNGKSFNAHYQHQRPGLLLLNGVVYLAYGSDCDANTYYGWLLGYNMTTLAQVSEFCTTPSGSEGAIWSCGMAPAVDSSGNIYVMVANGSFSNGGANANWGECFLKMSTSSGLSVSDWFCPSNQASLSSSDEDLGSGGPLLLPGTSLVTGAGKEGILFLLNTGNMGHYSTTHNSDVEQFKAFSEVDGVGQSPIYWQGPSAQYIYLSPQGGETKAYTFNGSTISSSSVGHSSETQADKPGGLSISSDGTANGILWVVDNSSGGTLRAYEAVPTSTLTELWNSQQDSSRDSLGTYVKFVSPIVSNGKVYVGTDGNLEVYGLLNASGTIYDQAVNLSYVATGGTASIQTDSNLPGGEWVALTGDTTGSSIAFTFTNVPTGTYDLTMEWKGNNNRGIAQVSLDGSNVGSPIDQYATNQTYPITDLGGIDLTTSGSHTLTLTCTGKDSASSAYELSCNQFIFTPTNSSIDYLAVDTTYTASGGNASIQTDSKLPGGEWVALTNDTTGSSITFTLSSVPAGNYSLGLLWKGNTDRGIAQVSVDGTNIGSPIDQYSATATYPTTPLGNVSFSSTGSHTITLTCTGKDSSSTAYWLSAAEFIFTPN